jgi:hypothetical protein
LNKVDLPAPFGPITPTMPPGGSVKEILEQQFVAIALVRPLASITLPPSRSGIWIRICALPGRRFSAVPTSSSNADTRLGLGLAGLGALTDPLQFVRDRLLATLSSRSSCSSRLAFLLEVAE